jgi:Zn-dependent peptidase ImmA (M78 family)
VAPRIAETAALEVLQRAGATTPPIDVESIAKHLLLVVKFDALPDGVSGMLPRRDDLALVAVNAAHPEHRQRFTIAHEIGHFMLHRGVFIDTTTRINERVSRTRSKSLMGLDTDEVQANAFAAELLMPSDMLEHEFMVRLRSGSRVVSAIVASLAERFNVSAQAMEIRLKVIGVLAPY